MTDLRKDSWLAMVKHPGHADQKVHGHSHPDKPSPAKMNWTKHSATHHRATGQIGGKPKDFTVDKLPGGVWQTGIVEPGGDTAGWRSSHPTLQGAKEHLEREQYRQNLPLIKPEEHKYLDALRNRGWKPQSDFRSEVPTVEWKKDTTFGSIGGSGRTMWGGALERTPQGWQATDFNAHTHTTFDNLADAHQHLMDGEQAAYQQHMAEANKPRAKGPYTPPDWS